MCDYREENVRRRVPGENNSSNSAQNNVPPADFLLPSSRSLRALMPACLDAVGLPTVTSLGTGAQARKLLDLPQVSRVCLVLVDGLGYENLAGRIGHAPTLRNWTQREPLITCAPSTTAAALTALATGELPGQTAMLSYSLKSPVTQQNFSLITFENSGVDQRKWQPIPTLAEQLGGGVSSVDTCESRSSGALAHGFSSSATSAHGFSSATSTTSFSSPSFTQGISASGTENNKETPMLMAFHEPKHEGSGLTLAAWRGMPSQGCATFEERANATARFLRSGGRFAYFYWGDVDHAGHRYGSESEEWTANLEICDAGLAYLAQKLPKDALIIVSADHGMIDPNRRIDIAQTPNLAQGVDLVSGEERALHLYTKEPENVSERWRSYLGEDSWVLTKEECRTLGLFGELSTHSASVMGDVLAFQAGRLSIVDSRGRKPGMPFLKGVHGSLTRREMLVPLFAELV